MNNFNRTIEMASNANNDIKVVLMLLSNQNGPMKKSCSFINFMMIWVINGLTLLKAFQGEQITVSKITSSPNLEKVSES